MHDISNSGGNVGGGQSKLTEVSKLVASLQKHLS